MQVTSREYSFENKLPYYFTGEPCENGHLARRNTHNGLCTECRKYKRANQWSQRADSWKGKAKYQEYHRRKLPIPTRMVSVSCECCGRSRGKRDFHLDHCHDSEKFRGWLCHNCNTGIGMLGDNLEGVLRAVEYLKKYG